ncbi:MAG: hypothetical protein ACOY5Y_04900 [Pseudomonadota bacterium]
MKTLMVALAATTAFSLSAGAVEAQPWMSINERQARLDDRIDAGVRSGDLTRNEAMRLRDEFRDLAQLENRYRRGGLSGWERADLDRRFDGLSAQIRYERRDTARNWFGGRDWRDDRGRWVSIERRQAQLDRRIDQGLRSGQLTRPEARRLREEFRDIARLEHRYRRGGLSNRELADLDRRFDRLAMQIRWERRDDDRRYGWNRN